MHAMVLTEIGLPLEWQERPDPVPGRGEIRVAVSACGVCRTDLHVVYGELPNPRLPIIPGHEIVGRIDAIGPEVEGLEIGMRVGIPWLGHTCGHCRYCLSGHENFCDTPLFTGFTRDGGYATCAVADVHYVFPLGETGRDQDLAPLLCAGLIGWRSLVMAGDAQNLGLYGFGAAAHIIAQVAQYQGRKVFAFATPATFPRRISPGVSAPSGPVDRMKSHRKNSMRRSSMRRSVPSCPSRSRPCARAAPSSAPAFI